MRNSAKALLLMALALAPAGCGESNAVVTDPSKLTPVTEEQKKEARQADDQLASEEHGNPVAPGKVKGKVKAR